MGKSTSMMDLVTLRGTGSLVQYLSGALVVFLIGASGCLFVSSFVQLSATPSQSSDGQAQRLRMLPVDLVSFRTNCADPVPAETVRHTILEKVFDGVSPFDGFPPPDVAPLLRKKRIKGWGADDPVFERLFKEVRPQIVVELGSFLGASAITMASLARNLSLDTTILCVDDFRGWPGFRSKKFKDIRQLNGNIMLLYQFMKNVHFTNATDYILPMPFSTTGAISIFCEWGIRPDLIEVDAAHDFHSAWIDINSAYAMLKPGGIMFGHDYFNRNDNEGVRRAVNLFAELKGLRVEPDGKHWILRTS